jgi:hypothetical protein
MVKPVNAKQQQQKQPGTGVSPKKIRQTSDNEDNKPLDSLIDPPGAAADKGSRGKKGKFYPLRGLYRDGRVQGFV